MDKITRLGTQVIIKNEKGEILMCKRCKKIGSGQWELPGGHVEFQETFKENVKKECFEEVGLDVKIGELISVSTNMIEDNHFVIFGFTTSSWSGNPKVMAPEEHSEIGWFGQNNLPTDLFIACKKTLNDYSSGVVFSEQ